MREHDPRTGAGSDLLRGRGPPLTWRGKLIVLGWSPRLLLWTARRLFPKRTAEFFGPPDHVLSDYLPADYAEDSQSREVAEFVHEEAGWMGKGPLAPVDETRWLESLGEPKLRGIVGAADLSVGAGVDEVLAAHVAEAR